MHKLTVLTRRVTLCEYAEMAARLTLLQAVKTLSTCSHCTTRLFSDDATRQSIFTSRKCATITQTSEDRERERETSRRHQFGHAPKLRQRSTVNYARHATLRLQAKESNSVPHLRSKKPLTDLESCNPDRQLLCPLAGVCRCGRG